MKFLGWLVLSSALLAGGILHAQDSGESLDPLVEVLQTTDDPDFQLDVLKGLSEALKGQRTVKMPPAWTSVAEKLAKSPKPEVRELAQSLSVKFGSSTAFGELRKQLRSDAVSLEVRKNALQTLISAKDPELPAVLKELLPKAELRAEVLRGVAVYDDPALAQGVLAIFPTLSGALKRDALNALTARPSYAKSLLAAIDGKQISRQELSADLIRQLRSLKNAEVDEWVNKAWGTARETSADKAKEIARYKTLVKAAGKKPDLANGRAMFARTCQQCHSLFGTGGKVGPDLTGSNRADLDYILENMVDPNAVIPNEYRASTIETKDDRTITGIVSKQDANSITVIAANEVLTIPRPDIQSNKINELSMMPDGLLEMMDEGDIRDLIAYLASPNQTPLKALPENVAWFFNEIDLTHWDGELKYWTVEKGELVGKSPGLKQNDFLKSAYWVGNFRLTLEVKLMPNTENSGVQIRSQALEQGAVKGYQADIGAGLWGKLHEENGRGTLWDKNLDAHVKPNDWNTYEIVAVGDRILTALNGKPGADFIDPTGAKEGLIALQLHFGGPFEIRFRKFQLETDPKPELKTVR